MKKNIIAIIAVIILLIAGVIIKNHYNSKIPSPVNQDPSLSAGLANPASENCIKMGGSLEPQEDASGNQWSICKFPNGNSCEEWAFFRGECKP